MVIGLFNKILHQILLEALCTIQSLIKKILFYLF